MYRVQIAKLGDTGLIGRLLPASGRRYVWHGVLWVVSFSALVIALARPVWGINMDVVEVQGVSILGVLDVSSSMAADDVLPSRLERAKITLGHFFQEMAGNEVGLILFAGSPFVYFPLTTDVNSALTFLASVDTNMVPAQGTALEAAVHLALDTFEPQSPSARVIVLLTDGESHEGDIQTAVERANEMGVSLFTIGIGDTDGAPVPILNDRDEIVTYKADAGGQLILTYLDEEPLQELASQTGGLYRRSTGTQAEIVALVRAINQLEKGFLDSRVEAQGIERFGIFLLISLIALTLEILLPNSRQRSSA